MATKKYAPKLPIQTDSNGDFIKIDDALVNVKQKLKTLILTNPGEKLMDPEFGVGIRKYLFESTSGIINYSYTNDVLTSIQKQDLDENIKNSIYTQVAKYTDDIKIYDIQVSLEDQTLEVAIFYNYRGLFNDNLSVNLGL